MTKIISKPKSIVESFDLNELDKIQEEGFYTSLLESLNEIKDSEKSAGKVLEEGLLSGIAGGIAGSVLAPGIMKSICKILGIAENGTLGQLLTSRLVLGALGTQLGLKM